MPVLYGHEASEVAVLPGLHSNLTGGLSFERNGPSIVIPDARSGDNTHNSVQRTGS